MGYPKNNGQWANTVDVTFVQSGEHHASFDSASIELGDRGTMCLTLACSAHTSSPTLDITIQTSDDDSTWRTVDTFSQQTTSDATTRKSFSGCDRYVRAQCVMGGTGGITFSLSGDAK